MSEFDVEEFIHDIFVRRRLWDGSSGNKDVLWGELSEKFELPIVILKRKWDNLRSSFRKQLKKVPRNAQNAFLASPHLLQSKFQYYQSMLFLPDRIRAPSISPRSKPKVLNVGVTSSSNVANQGSSNGIASTKGEKSTPSNNGVQMKRKREDSDEENVAPSNEIASTKGEKSTSSNNGVQMKRQRHDSDEENLTPSNGMSPTKGEMSTPSSNGVQMKRQRDDEENFNSSNGIASRKGEKSTPSNNGVQKKRQRDDSDEENVEPKKIRSED